MCLLDCDSNDLSLALSLALEKRRRSMESMILIYIPKRVFFSRRIFGFLAHKAQDKEREKNLSPDVCSIDSIHVWMENWLQYITPILVSVLFCSFFRCLVFFSITFVTTEPTTIIDSLLERRKRTTKTHRSLVATNYNVRSVVIYAVRIFDYAGNGKKSGHRCVRPVIMGSAAPCKFYVSIIFAIHKHISSIFFWLI